MAPEQGLCEHHSEHCVHGWSIVGGLGQGGMERLLLIVPGRREGGPTCIVDAVPHTCLVLDDLPFQSL